MDQLKSKYLIVQKTMNALEQGIRHFEQKDAEHNEYEIFRESLIQRFEYTIDTFWKFTKLYMQDYQKLTVDIMSPRSVLRAAVEANLISPTELKQLLDAVTDRNLSSHAYNEEIAQQIAERIPHHYSIIKSVFARMTLMQ
jgi:nucleotidyltransferase substrate binding protein (TIGR01987 family)